MQKIEPRKPQLSQDDAQIVTGGGEDCIHCIADAAFEAISAHQAIVFGVPDDRFDGISTLQCTAQRTSETAFLSGNVHGGVLDAVATVTAIHEATLRPLCTVDTPGKSSAKMPH